MVRNDGRIFKERPKFHAATERRKVIGKPKPGFGGNGLVQHFGQYDTDQDKNEFVYGPPRLDRFERKPLFGTLGHDGRFDNAGYEINQFEYRYRYEQRQQVFHEQGKEPGKDSGHNLCRIYHCAYHTIFKPIDIIVIQMFVSILRQI